jgi:hypothetical protein
MKILYDPTAPNIRAPAVSEVDFALTSNDVETIISSSSAGQTTVEDAVLDQVTSATVDNGHHLHAAYIGAVFSSSDESVAIVSINGASTRVSDGTATIIARSPDIAKGISLAFSRETGQMTSTFSAWVSGTAATHATANVESRISGKNATDTTLQIFSTVNHTTPSYVRNTSLWCAGYASALTGLSAWQSDYGNGQTRAQTAITARHVVGAAHYGTPVTIGGTIRFITTDGTVVNRTITHTKQIGTTDIQLSLLSSDLPASIAPVSLLPTTWADYIRSPEYGIPCLLRNQYGEARIFDLDSLTSSSTTFTSNMPASRSAWYRQLVTGDSGGSACLMFNGTLGLVTTWHGANSGPAYQAVDWATEIAALDTLGSISTGYTPARIDLSSFTDFS